jgi:hypothetical protein
MSAIAQDDGDEQTALENRQPEVNWVEASSIQLEHDGREPRD